MLVYRDAEIVIIRLKLRCSPAGIGGEVPERVFEPVRRKARAVVIRDGVDVIIRHSVRGYIVFIEQARYALGAAYQFSGAPLGVLLRHIVAVQEVHRVREHRRRDIVEQPRERLRHASGEVPDDERRAHAVPVPRIFRQTSKAGEGGIFTAAVHADVL